MRKNLTRFVFSVVILLSLGLSINAKMREPKMRIVIDESEIIARIKVEDITKIGFGEIVKAKIIKKIKCKISKTEISFKTSSQMETADRGCYKKQGEYLVFLTEHMKKNGSVYTISYGRFSYFPIDRNNLMHYWTGINNVSLRRTKENYNNFNVDYKKAEAQIKNFLKVKQVPIKK